MDRCEQEGARYQENNQVKGPSLPRSPLPSSLAKDLVLPAALKNRGKQIFKEYETACSGQIWLQEAIFIVLWLELASESLATFPSSPVSSDLNAMRVRVVCKCSF